MSNNVKFSANQLHFIEWLAQAKAERVPNTQAEFAETIGVRSETLCRWKRLPELTEAATQRARQIIREDLPEIYGATRKAAKEGSFQHAKLLFEMAGEYVEKRGFSSDDPLKVIIEYADD